MHSDHTKKNLEDMKAELNNSVKGVCESIVDDKLVMYQGVAQNFSQFFNSENLKKMFSEKMDITMFERKHTKLAQKTEIE